MTPHSALLGEVKADLQMPRLQHSSFFALQGLYRVAQKGRCQDVDRDAVYDLLETAAANPAYRAVPAELHNLHVLMSEEAFARRNLDLTMHHVEQALSANFTMTTLVLAVQMLRSAGLYPAAQHFIDEGRAHEPRNPLRALVWRRQISSIERSLSREIQQASRHDDTKY
jgi:hypothetical protein